MRTCLVLIFSILVSSAGNAQFATDTLKHRYLTNGTLDSVASPGDFLAQPVVIQGSEGYSNEMFWRIGMGSFGSSITEKNAVFSALPHIGFAYQFGTQATQQVRADYHQTFSGNWIVNASLLTNSTAGFYRNSNFKSGTYSTLLQRNEGRFPMKFTTEFSNETRNWTGGVIDPQQALSFPSDFLAVSKNDANTLRKNQKINYEILFSFLKDSTKTLGIISKSGYKRTQRTYFETGNLIDIYPTIYFDTATSNDLFRINDFNQKLAWFSHLKNGNHLEIGLDSRFWTYKDSLYKRSQLEMSAYDQLNFVFGKFNLSHKGLFNFFGANFGLKSFSELKANFLDVDWKVVHHIVSWLPEAEQRTFSSNNHFFELENLSLQTLQKIELTGFKSLNKWGLSLKIRQDFFNNLYLFNLTQGQWDNTSENSDFAATQVSIGATYRLKNWRFGGDYQFSSSSKSVNFLPQHLAKASFLWRGGIFKAKNLQSVLSADVFWQSSSTGFDLIPTMDAIWWNEQGVVNNGLLNLSVMAGFEVSTFRFFVKATNLGYFWTDRTTQLWQGYTLPGMQIRLGVTWDFWN
jgi:hypothetical protein